MCNTQPTVPSPQSLEDLPKVTLQEDEEGNIHLKNLSAHVAANEEEAFLATPAPPERPPA